VILSTAFALIALLAGAAAALFAYLARRDSLECADALMSFRSSRALLAGINDRMLAVEGRMNRLAGRVYAQARRPREDDGYDAPDCAFANAEHPSALDPELAAELALEQAPAVSPGKQR